MFQIQEYYFLKNIILSSPILYYVKLHYFANAW